MEAEEEEIDTLHRQIYQLIVNDVPKAVATYLDMIRERRKLLEEVSKVIEPINVRKFTADELSDRRITGADGGANGKELEGFYFGIAGAIAYTSTGLEEEDKTPISFGTSLLWDDEFDRDEGLRLFVISSCMMLQGKLWLKGNLTFCS